MIEWAAQFLLIPVILAPIVLIFGFAGCDLVFPLEPHTPEKTFEATPNTDRQLRNRCIVQRIEPARLFRSGSVVYITIQRPTNSDLLINQMFISQVADTGDPYDSAADLTGLLTAPLAVLADPNNGPLELDPVDYHLDHTKPLLLAFDVGSVGNVRAATSVPSAEATAFLGPIQNPPLFEASVADRQAGYTAENSTYLVQRIDVT